MNTNYHMGQLIGPFKAKEELYDKIIANANVSNVLYIKHLGIQAEVGTFVYINKELFEIGKTGIYEITNCEVNSIYFENDTDKNYIIDYIIKRAEI